MSEVKYSRKHQGTSLGLGEILIHQSFVCVLGHSEYFILWFVVKKKKKFDIEALGVRVTSLSSGSQT